MDPESFQRLEELFHELVDLPQAEQRRRLSELRRDGPQIVARLERMLARDSEAPRSEAFGASEASEGSDTGGLPSGALELPATIGPFRLARILGEGGMGIVYEATQEQPFRRRVALKLIRHGLGSEAVVSRFRMESQALALMDHPNVARVFDAGTTEDGRPYFVMELVEGLPVTDFCDQRRLTTPERVRLFLDVCEAVQHAHRRGVLHRDLKPSNVLVQFGEGAPRVKVIDFGIARALDHAELERERFTRFGELLGTPEYMSPEQAAGEALDTRSDVYSLGVVLHELLIGELPLPAEVLRSAGFDEIRRQIRELDTPRPSTRVGSGDRESVELASRRSTDPVRLARELRGDLDWILLKALTKEPDRRYESPLELEADLERHLSGEPVEAGPPDLRYRLGKLLRRHRVAVGFVAVLAVAILLALGGLTTGLVRARAAERAAQQARAEAEQEAQISGQISDFLVDLFAVSDPIQDADPVTARELLDRGVERIRTELVDQPGVRARLLQEMGRVYGNLGLYEEARPLLEEAVELRRSLDGDRELAAALHRLGSFHYDFLEEIEPALAALEESLEVAQRAGVADSELVPYLNDLARVQARAQRFDDAREHYRQALDVLPQTELAGGNGGARRSRGEIEGNLGVLAQYQGDHITAIEHLERALSLLEGELSADHPEVSVVAANLAFSLLRTGRPATALVYFERDLSVTRAAYGEEHPIVATTLYQMGQAFEALGQFEEAASYYDQARDVFSAALGPEHYRTTDVIADRGKMETMRGHHAEARRNLELAEVRYEASDHPVSHIARLRTLEWLAQLERYEERWDKAAEHCREALLEVEDLPADRQAIEAANCRLQLARIASQRGDEESAAQLASEALAPGRAHTLDDPSGAFSLAAWHAYRGELDPAFDLLNASLERGSAHAWAPENPDLAPLRDDPRFDAWAARLQRRLGSP